eukprot:1161054-Pelagomonas_calceolata.AAC.1
MVIGRSCRPFWGDLRLGERSGLAWLNLREQTKKGHIQREVLYPPIATLGKPRCMNLQEKKHCPSLLLPN